MPDFAKILILKINNQNVNFVHWYLVSSDDVIAILKSRFAKQEALNEQSTKNAQTAQLQSTVSQQTQTAPPMQTTQFQNTQSQKQTSQQTETLNRSQSMQSNTAPLQTQQNTDTPSRVIQSPSRFTQATDDEMSLFASYQQKELEQKRIETQKAEAAKLQQEKLELLQKNEKERLEKLEQEKSAKDTYLAKQKEKTNSTKKETHSSQHISSSSTQDEVKLKNYIIQNQFSQILILKLTELQFELISLLETKKSEYNGKATFKSSLGTVCFFVFGIEKKKIAESDVVHALLGSHKEHLPLLFVYKGELPKKYDEVIENHNILLLKLE
jgi:hypothetical protein